MTFNLVEFIGEIGKLVLFHFGPASMACCALLEVLVKAAGEILCKEADFSVTVGMLWLFGIFENLAAFLSSTTDEQF